jgi:hypothetical protein
MKAKIIELDESTRLIDLPHEPGPEKTSAGGIVLRKVSEVEQKPVDWLWEGRIARGEAFAFNRGSRRGQVIFGLCHGSERHTGIQLA